MHLWPIFQDLHRSRGSTGFGPARITFVDIDAYQRVTRIRLAAWELEAIRRADDCYLIREAERTKADD